MDYQHHNTEARTNKHLSRSERFYIQMRLNVGESVTTIAKALGRSRTTIYAEIKRGLCDQIKQSKRITVYSAERGQVAYEETRQGSFSRLKFLRAKRFIEWVEKMVKQKNWSFDAAVGYAMRNKLYSQTEMVSMKTLYNYLHLGVLKVKPLDLPQVLRRSLRKQMSRKFRRHLGKSIDERDSNIETRKEFGHWEIDTVRGSKGGKDEVLISMLERKTRCYIVLRSSSAKAKHIQEALQTWLKEASKYVSLSQICKTITADNGLEFSRLSELESQGIKVYFAHPYSAWQRGSNERHNGLLRRFIKKGQPINTVSDDELEYAIYWENNLPRKILHYATPQEAFVKEVRGFL